MILKQSQISYSLNAILLISDLHFPIDFNVFIGEIWSTRCKWLFRHPNMSFSPFKAMLQLFIRSQLWKVTNNKEIFSWHRHVLEFEHYRKVLVQSSFHGGFWAIVLDIEIGWILHGSLWGTRGRPLVVVRTVRTATLLTTEIVVSLVIAVICCSSWADFLIHSYNEFLM